LSAKPASAAKKTADDKGIVTDDFINAFARAGAGGWSAVKTPDSVEPPKQTIAIPDVIVEV
jgi:hypothetical protein